MSELERRRPPGTLYGKKSAAVVRGPRSKPPVPRPTTEYLTRGQRHELWDLVAEARAMEERGLIKVLRRPRWDEEHAMWTMPVHRLKHVPAWRRRPALIAYGVLGAVAILLGLGWWLFATLAAIPGAALLAAVLGGFIAYVIGSGRKSSGGSSIFIETITRVRIR